MNLVIVIGGRAGIGAAVSMMLAKEGAIPAFTPISSVRSAEGTKS